MDGTALQGNTEDGDHLPPSASSIFGWASSSLVMASTIFRMPRPQLPDEPGALEPPPAMFLFRVSATHFAFPFSGGASESLS